MSTEIKRILKGNEWDSIRNANSPSVANPFATVADITAGVPNGNLLISGSAAWSGTNLDFDVTALEYLIAGVTYTTAPTTVTLAVGDPTNPRFDAIVADNTGTVSVIIGTPAVTPLTPSIGEDQVLVQYVLVGAGATTPAITTENIYREGSPLTDWTPGVSCVSAGCPTADFTSTTPAPFQGPQCTLIDFSTYSTGRYIKYTTLTPVVRYDYAVLTFRIWLFDDLTTIDGGAGRRPFVRLYANSGTTWLGTVYIDSWGLQRNVTNTWQLVSIPIAAFTGNPGVNQIDQFRIHCVEYVASPVVTQIAIDDVKLQSGYGASISAITPIDVQDDGVTIASTSKINFVDGTDTTVSVTQDTLNNRVDVSVDRPFEVRDGGSAFEPTISGINFTGAGVSLSTPSGPNPLITVNIPGGGAGASGIFGIADAAGVYTYYSDLGAAIAAATVGQTIQLFTDYTETSSVSVFMKNGVDINLNGHTYEYATADINDTLSDGGIPATVTIFNGTLKRTGSSAPTTVVGVGLKLSNNSTKVTLHGVTVIAEDGSNCCIVQGGKLSGGYFRQIGSTTGSANAFLLNGSGSIADNIHVHADNLFSRIDLGKISNSYFRNDGARAVYLNSGEAYNITGYSTAGEGILVGTAKLYNSTGRSTVSFGISTNTASEIYNCSGYSSGASGISNSNYAENCVGSSAALYGIFTGSNSKTYNCTGRSSSLYGIFSRGLIVKTSAISTYNNPLGHGFGGVENNDEIIDCYAEVANAAANGVYAPTTSPYVTGFSGRGMTQLLDLLSNAQSNTEDNFGNILIG